MNKTKNSLSMQFKILWTGQLLSKTGSGISTFVLGIHVLEKTGSTASFSMMLLASFLPSALLNPAGGLIQLSEASRFLLSPAIAAFLISRISLTSILWIDFISFITAAAAVLHQV